MTKKRYPTNILEQVQASLEAWKRIDSELKIGELSQETLTSLLNQGRQIETQFDALEAQLTELRNQRDQVFWESWQVLKRLRAGIKAVYGDDSSQYEMIGGTRLSERKTRKKTTT